MIMIKLMNPCIRPKYVVFVHVKELQTFFLITLLVLKTFFRGLLSPLGFPIPMALYFFLLSNNFFSFFT